MEKNEKTCDEYEKRLAELTAEYEKKLKELSCGKVPEKKKKIRDLTAEKGDEYTTVRLFKDGDKYRDDVLVGINGYMIRIKRGIPVTVKRRFADLISKAEENTAALNAEFLNRDGKMEKYF